MVFGFSVEAALGASFIDLGHISSSNLNSQSSVEVQTSVESASDVSISHTDIAYKQSGRVLGVIPISFQVKAVTYADGRLELKSPWYAFLITRKHIMTTTGS